MNEYGEVNTSIDNMKALKAVEMERGLSEGTRIESIILWSSSVSGKRLLIP